MLKNKLINIISLLVYWNDDNVEPDDNENLDSIRTKELLKNDPVKTVNIFVFFKSKLSELETIAGGPQKFNEILSHMDQMIIYQVQKLIS